jgi:hypothetical protein
MCVLRSQCVLRHGEPSYPCMLWCVPVYHAFGTAKWQRLPDVVCIFAAVRVPQLRVIL